MTIPTRTICANPDCHKPNAPGSNFCSEACFDTWIVRTQQLVEDILNRFFTPIMENHLRDMKTKGTH